MIKVMIADDQELIRESLKVVVDMNPDMQVTGLAADGAEQGRFAGTVGSNDAIDISTRKLDVHVFIENSFAELNGKICQCDHNLKLI